MVAYIWAQYLFVDRVRFEGVVVSWVVWVVVC